MDQLQVIEKLFETFSNTLDREHHMYLYSAAIFDVWSVGTDLEKNLSHRLVVEWSTHLWGMLNDAYRKTKYNYITGKTRPEFEEFKDNWKKGMRDLHTLHHGIQRALDLIM